MTTVVEENTHIAAFILNSFGDASVLQQANTRLLQLQRIMNLTFVFRSVFKQPGLEGTGLPRASALLTRTVLRPSSSRPLSQGDRWFALLKPTHSHLRLSCFKKLPFFDFR